MLIDTAEPHPSAYRRIAIYLMTTLGLCAIFAIFGGSNWQGTEDTHTLMESIATTLALLVGALALVRFYSMKDNTILLVGTGFLGTALLDGYHAIITSTSFAPYLFPELPVHVPWSWMTSRFLLSLLLFLSWAEWNWQRGGKRNRIIQESHIYALAAALTLVCLAFLTLVAQPGAFLSLHLIGRPEEFLPAVFFIAALIGYLNKGAWRYDDFEHWLVMALIVSVIGQTVFMSSSINPFDFGHNMAHMLKNMSYVLVLTGLLFSTYKTFKLAEQGAARLTQSMEALALSNKNLEKTARERQQAELLARQNEEHLRRIFENVPDGIITTDSHATILAFNPGAERAFGYSAAEVIGKNVKMLMPDSFAHGHDTHVRDYHSGHGASAVGQRRELLGRCKDGTTFVMDLTISDSTRQSGERMILGVMRDITHKKAAESYLAGFVDKLEQSNEDLLQFAYVASHDLRAPLRGIGNLANFIREDIGDNLDNESCKNFDLLQNRIQRMERLLDDLLAYSRAGRSKTALETVDVQELLQDTITLIAPPEGIDTHVNCDVMKVRIDRTPLQQVLMNLIGNAVKHHDQPTGSVTIDVSETQEAINISVADDGPGIPEQFHDRIFGMFQTLKPRDELEGSGMGLAVVKKLVESIGGSIDVHSADGTRGTRFTVLWPKVSGGQTP